MYVICAKTPIQVLKAPSVTRAMHDGKPKHATSSMIEYDRSPGPIGKEFGHLCIPYVQTPKP